MRYERQEHASGGTYWEQYYPLAAAKTIEDLDAYPWPRVDWCDYDALASQCAQYPDHAVKAG